MNCQHARSWLCGLWLYGAAAHGATDDAITVVAVADASQPGKAYTATATAAASVAALCRVVQDYAGYAAFMPNVRSAVPVGAGDGHVLVDMTLDLPLGQVKRYRLRLEPHSEAGQCRLAWQLVPRADLATADTIADTSGYWLFTPLPGDADRSRVLYHVHADPGPVPFGFGWIVDALSRRSLPRTIEAVRTRAAAQAP
ncbi:polyketide cyclase/dehydrase/lipid transport protein [Pseudoduganella flava]|uniref:Polyketide cyclase/dehydrase/lipid transport protein n=1 Tax=Pseudoduganella flava TaxID=871742 RepID=A0A562Q499_9BURK|nr:SRPBCC family protein [Pseudoduganella flava]QGZ41568.1 hypothetical protein GO485_22605 [Pseudoduganella flava]TWI51548.1 polyketide cyclase/dehydrase/lipid transport protein [Pseudoduganella flava]